MLKKFNIWITQAVDARYLQISVRNSLTHVKQEYKLFEKFEISIVECWNEIFSICGNLTRNPNVLELAERLWKAISRIWYVSYLGLELKSVVCTPRPIEPVLNQAPISNMLSTESLPIFLLRAVYIYTVSDFYVFDSRRNINMKRKMFILYFG